jgi:hypothetical protein
MMTWSFLNPEASRWLSGASGVKSEQKAHSLFKIVSNQPTNGKLGKITIAISKNWFLEIE